MVFILLFFIELDSFETSQVKLAKWNYCKMDTNETRQDAVKMLIKYLEYGKEDKNSDGYKKFIDNCKFFFMLHNKIPSGIHSIRNLWLIWPNYLLCSDDDEYRTTLLLHNGNVTVYMMRQKKSGSEIVLLWWD